ncbi:hypothetical protein MTR67_000279 [Solanum verrucosum]|uniref:Protein kinase domain-containing protein n=1 Tax=Solanum verrucosum TaxID=315347 RepID=A0AAF0T6U8_SOLVR|nr:hypothetical protein MTR67_000279 [Solanum verrucosum]
MLDNGNMVLVTQSVPSNMDYDDEYYNTQTSDTTNATNSGDKLVFEENGVMYVLKRNNQRQILSPRSIPSASDNYHRVTLNFDGVLSHYYHSRTLNSRGWNILWSQPNNICIEIDGDKGPGSCGYNNVCSLGSSNRPVCNCPKGYSLVDPNDAYGDCKPVFSISCDEVGRGSPEDLYSFITIRDTDWPKSDFQQISPSTEQDCQNACLNDCFCVVAIYRSNSCWKKKLPLSNGRIDTNLNSKAFMKIRKDGVPPLSIPGFPNSGSNRSKNWRNLSVVLSVLLGSSVLVNFLFISVFCWGFFHIYKKKMKILRPTSHVADSMCHSFTYKELVEATKDFKEELGRGAFGIVYKGVMPIGSRNVVAIKKLDRVAHEAEKEFITEYMSNGTVTSFIFGDLKPTWSQRTNIVMGVARGLAYLHEECSTQIIHCDIKPQNILLDDHHVARISDFGLSKLMMINQSRTLTNIRGTRGYVAPEWFRNSQVTVKVDVYSFGVLLLEIITCRKNYENEESYGPEAILTDWVLDCLQEGKLEALVQSDFEALNDKKQLERLKPRHPPHMDIHISHAHGVFPDNLDEEFDTFPTSRGSDKVRMRYGRLRSIGGRIQTVIGDLATQGERFHSLLSWRDPRASALFVTFCLFAAIVMYITPFQVVALLIGIYVLRHSRFRHKPPPLSTSFFKRLPARADCML